MTNENVNTNNDQGFEIGWDDEFEVEERQYAKLEGRYFFSVTEFRRERFNGSSRLPACNRAVIKIAISNPADGYEYEWEESFLMHSKCIWKLNQFLISIGQRQPGEKVKADWNTVVGSTGICECKPREYNGKTYNSVAKWIAPQEQTPPSDVSAAFNQQSQNNPALSEVSWN